MAIPGIIRRPTRRALPRPRTPGGWGPQMAAQAGQQLGAPPEVDPYDYTTDPVLQRIKAFGAQRLADAQAAAIRARQVAQSDYGDVQARLGREQIERPRALTESLNKSNLFYSTEYGKQQTGLARTLAENAADEQRRHQERLAGIDQGVLDVERGVQGESMSAEEAAAERLRERLGDLPVGRQERRPMPGAGQVRPALAARLGGLGGAPRPRPRSRPRPPRRGIGYPIS